MASVLERARASLERAREVIRFTPARPRAPEARDGDIVELFETHVVTRLVDIASHAMRERGEAYYTICSAGHEGNGAIGRATRTSDPSLLHYRSGAFFLERARATGGAVDGARDLLASLAGSTADPISGGRHKVFGSIPLGILPQTSTIASHLPKAVGLAVAIERAARLGIETPYPKDAIVVCSFGDASINHSTAVGAMNAASWVTFQKLPVPVLFVCEDNGLGISVRTPPGWIETRLRALPGIEHVRADGTDPLAMLDAARRAVEHVRSTRSPVALHMACVRLWGHAGSDADTEYREAGEIAEVDARDPLLASSALVVSSGAMSPEAALALVARHEARIATLVEETIASKRIESRAEVVAPLARYSPERVKAEARAKGPPAPAADRAAAERAQPFGLAVRGGLAELLARYPQMLVFGEDVAQKGGVYGLTAGLWRRFGPKRVFNTLLDEQTILGLALGAGMAGLLPFPEIQYLAYLHNAIDQVRAEAGTYPFLSAGQLAAPMVVRIAGMASREGFGGHFHNENSLSSLRDVPGLVLGVPCRGDDAVA
ncbi:MAG: MFS transporter, partial [Deltaproteobacteria bacterium]|nr:MFS transporter [Deltaproteobacteria bacterium]